MKNILLAILFFAIALPLMGQSRAVYPGFDLFYVVNSTVGGGGLSRDQIEGLLEHVTELQERPAPPKLLLFISDGDEPQVFNGKDDLEGAIKRLYISSLPYPLSSTRETRSIVEALYAEEPFAINGPTRVHFVVPESYEEELRDAFTFLVDNVEALGLFAQGNLQLRFYNKAFSRNQTLEEHIKSKAAFGSNRITAEFVSY